MATFEYIARTPSGEQIAGVMQADNEASVARTLDERELYPVRVTEQAPRRAAVRRGGGRIRVRDVGVAYGQLADLLRAGVPLLRAIETLSRAGANRNLSQLFLHVRDEVSGGKTLADGMAGRPEVFSSLHMAMIRAGERGGFLEDVLTNMADYIERQDDLRSRVRGALIYPLVLTSIGVVLMVGVLVGLVPRFKPFFTNVSLPLPTTFLFALSDLLVKQLPLLLGLVLLLVITIRAFLRSDRGHMLWDRWRLRIPLVGKPMRMVSITRFCRILGTLLHNGVPILESLAISKDATGCVTLTESIDVAAANVKAGEPLAAPLKQSGLFPESILEMIAVGEESNQLEKVLIQIADTVERRTGRQVDQMMRLIEPLILVVLAAAIGFVAVGLLYPIFTMSQTIT